MKLSVCIPVYKVEAYVERCARSLFAQTLDDMEFVFVDDCSPDGSVDVIQWVLEEFPNRKAQVRFLRHEANRGLMAARNTAVAAAQGDWIAHCDADDWIDPGLYETMLRRAEESEADMVFCPIVRNENETFSSRPFDAFGGSGSEFLEAVGRIHCFNPAVNKICRRSIVCCPDLELPESVTLAEDLCRTVQLAAKCRRIVSCNGSCYHYRLNETSMSRRFDAERSVRSLVTVYDVICRRVPLEQTTRVRKSLLRDILNFAVRFNVLSRDEWNRLVADFRQLATVPWPEDTSAYRRLLVETGVRSRLLARGLAAVSRLKGFGGF